MAMFLRQNEDRSEIQKRVGADLQERLAAKNADLNAADDHVYRKSDKKRSPIAVFIIVLVTVTLITVLALAFNS